MEMANPTLSSLERTLMGLIVVVTNLTGLPTVLRVFKHKETVFEGYVFSMSILTSFMYHLCEVGQCEIFLNELQWHRLDNVFAITSFELIILHLFGAVHGFDIPLKWSTLLSSIIIQ
jgi:Protein of unknown function (DUF3522)